MSTDVTTQTWLDRMHTYLKWKIVAPEPNNPFKPPMSDKVLAELATQKPVLAKYVQLKCSMDGEEILKINNLATLSLETTHPELSKLSKVDLKRYLEFNKIMEIADQEMTQVQELYKSELARRKSPAE